MKSSMKIVAAAALFSAAGFGGAMAQSQNDVASEPDTGTYYQGAERPVPGMEGGMTLNAPLIVQPEKIPGGESAYYPGLERNPGVDHMSTGSISGGTDGGTQDDTIVGGEGDYYSGANPDANLR